MIEPSTLKELTNIVGHDHILTRPEDLADYATDATELEFMPEMKII